MTNEEAFKHLESVEFSGHANVASGLRVFLTYVEGSEPYRCLYDQADKEPVFDRLCVLAATHEDELRENINDTAVAAYLCLLNGTQWNDKAKAQVSAYSPPGKWFWARRVVKEM